MKPKLRMVGGKSKVKLEEILIQGKWPIRFVVTVIIVFYRLPGTLYDDGAIHHSCPRPQDCPIKFELTVDVKKNLEAKLQFTGIKCNPDISNLQSRPFRDTKRKEMALLLQNILPALLTVKDY